MDEVQEREELQGGADGSDVEQIEEKQQNHVVEGSDGRELRDDEIAELMAVECGSKGD